MIGECSDYNEGDSPHSSRAQVIQVEALGKGGVVIILATVIVTLIIAAVAWGDARRAMDRASIAEREARIAQDKYTYVQGELAKRGIHISTDGH
jgi:hypothetical protein